jgi:hypothetical protein
MPVHSFPTRRSSDLNVAGTPTIVSAAQLNQILDAYNLPPLHVYDARVKVSGNATRVIPDTVALLLPPPVDPTDYEGTQLGATFWGTTAESLDPRYGLESGQEAGITAGVYTEEDPISLWTKASAIALPVLANPDLSFKAVVSA